jgi:transposase InsO family protein
MITSRAVFPLHYCITGVSSRRHAAIRDYAETLAGQASPILPIWFSAISPPRLQGSSWSEILLYIPTWQGWLYLATVIDCFNKEVIGYAMASHMRTELVTDALDMAARNHALTPGCIMHSDRGSQYTSIDYLTKLAELGLSHSLGRTGVCWDNGVPRMRRELVAA